MFIIKFKVKGDKQLHKIQFKSTKAYRNFLKMAVVDKSTISILRVRTN